MKENRNKYKSVRDIEKQDCFEQLRHNRKIRKMELNTKKKEMGDSLFWVWEFSKKLVLICSALYVFGFFYACVVMWRFFDFTYLGTFIEQSSDILRTCVFGYFIKAGIENVFKIKGTKTESTNLSHADETTPPDGEE